MTSHPKWLDAGSRPHLAHRTEAAGGPSDDASQSPFYPLLKAHEEIQSVLPTNNAAFEIVLREILELLEKKDEQDSERN